MNGSCPVPTPAEADYGSKLAEVQRVMLADILAAVRETQTKAAETYVASGLDGQPAPEGYFAAVAHQALYCVLCGANPETFAGGDPRIAVEVIRNAQNIARHHWGATIELTPRPSA